MQNAATTSHTGGGGNHWQAPNLPSMYAQAPQSAQQQRSTSNPRQYSSTDLTGVGGEPRRDDPAQVYQDGYSGYPQGGNYPGMPNVNYPYGQGMGMQGYPNTSANAPRRASGTKPASTPPASAPAGNPSPSSRYYPQQQGTPDPSSSVSAPSPYQPSSAPPQVTSHQQSQPQTAHPYGGGYYSYYDQHHQPNQWSSPYAQSQTSFPQPSGRGSQTSSTGPQTSASDPQHRQQPPNTTPYDYSQYQGYGNHDRNANPHPSQPWQTPTSATNRYSMNGQNPQSQPWQGYPQHHGMPQPMTAHHMPQGGMMPGQYGWQQQQPWNAQGYGYPPITPHTASNPAAAAPVHSLSKKESKDYDGLGKRPVESGTEDEEEKDGKKKKGKKEEVEKPVPKPPAKSHLNPPRQAQSMWQLFFTDELNKAKAAAASGNSPGGTPHHAKLNVAQIAKDAGIAYANLNAEQKAYYVGKVQESKDQYAKELAAWRATLTPEDIRVENAFRAQQRKEGKSRKGNLKDPNAPKKPLSAYFLFLKGIREDDALRARVWGDESETTKQSVLAAERWRSLSDEEKKPFLSQAERDKQEYEAARKIYEEDAAARARGEDVPARTYPEPALHVPTPVIRDVKPGETPSNETPLLTTDPTAESAKDESETTMFPAFLNEEAPHAEVSHDLPAAEQGRTGSIDFGFADSLDMDLGGFQNVAAERNTGEQEWGNLTNLMGEDSKPVSESNQNADVSVAPALEEAVAETAADGTVEQELPVSEEGVQEVARAAEGELTVPSDFQPPTSVVGEAAMSAEASGVPTEEVNEMPQTDLPPVVEEVNQSDAPAEAAEEAQTAETSGVFNYNLPASEEQQPAEENAEQSIFSYAMPEEQAQPSEEQAKETNEPEYEAPQPVDIPSATTVEPAKEATEESTSAPPPVEDEAPAADGV